MSVEVDNRVVQMEFDNKNFEQGVAVSLKTLEKLKKALQLDKAVDSLQHVDQAINKFDSSGLTRMEQSLANLESRFSSIGTIGARVLENLTDKAVQMSSRMLQSIFVEPVQQGLSKYDEMMNSKQTMKAALGSGMMSEIDESLATLQHYSDETSYSFTTMTGALANFVSAGQKNLPKTTKSITGIANAAAKAGIGISQATPAFNAFSKAIGAGKMTLMQWQSLELMNFTKKDGYSRKHARHVEPGMGYCGCNANLPHLYTTVLNSLHEWCAKSRPAFSNSAKDNYICFADIRFRRSRTP